MTTYAAALALVEKLQASGIAATADPRAVTPPCVLVHHADAARDTLCTLAVSWELVALAPGPFNADAWQALDTLADAVLAATDAEGYRVVAYRLALDNPPLPAYLFTFTGGVDL